MNGWILKGHSITHTGCANVHGHTAIIKIITDTGCGTIHLAGCVIEVMGNKGAMTIRVTTPSTSSGGGTTNAQFTYINHGGDYAPGWRRDYSTKNQQPAFALGQTGSTVGNDKAVGWNSNSGVL